MTKYFLFIVMGLSVLCLAPFILPTIFRELRKCLTTLRSIRRPFEIDPYHVIVSSVVFLFVLGGVTAVTCYKKGEGVLGSNAAWQLFFGIWMSSIPLSVLWWRFTVWAAKTPKVKRKPLPKAQTVRNK